MKHQFTPKISVHLLAVTTAALMATTVQAVPEAQFQSAFTQFIQATTGDDSAIDRSADAFAALLKAEPGNPVLMAYVGAATSMKAGASWLPWKKMGYAEDGLALLDKALALLTPAHEAPGLRQVPATLEVRYVAANTFLAVPGFMNRGARGAKLLAQVLASPLLAATPLEFRGDVWMAGARLASREKHADEARNYLDQVIKANAPQAQMARTQLKALAS